MRVSLMTRSRSVDYRFIGRPEVERWWNVGDVEKVFYGEKPSVAVRRTRDGWQALLAGIPANRRDGGGRVIRYSVLFESEGAAEDPAIVIRAVAEWLEASVPMAVEDERFVQDMQGIFSDEEIEVWFKGGDLADGNADQDLAGEIEGRLMKFFSALAPRPEAATSVAPPQPGPWIGGLRNEGARGQFVAFVRGLTAPDAPEGLALVCHLFRDREQIEQRARPLVSRYEENLALLAEDQGAVEKVYPKAEGGEMPPSPTTAMDPTRRPWKIAMATILTIALLMVAWVFLRRAMTTP